MVRGLTKYINIRKDEYMEDHEFPHNSVLILDGDSVAINIYLQLENKNTCFGGDYDKYAGAVEKFFDMLSDCKIIAYVLFDGATDQSKVGTAAIRLSERIRNSLELNCSNENVVRQMIPLCLTEVFKVIVKKRNIAMAMCVFECDGEVANIANQLNCPVLSYDSDYFIFNVKYIPFILDGSEQNLHVSIKLITNNTTNVKERHKFLKCKMFNRVEFLRKTRLSQGKLPILSVYLGNDVIDRVKNMRDFLKYLRVKGGAFVDVIIKWLAGKSVYEARQIMLDYYKDSHMKTKVSGSIKETLEEYQCRESKYLVYLQAGNANECGSNNDFQFDIPLPNISKVFLSKYTNCFYHHHFLDILLFHKYYPRPLVEHINKNHSHTPSLPLVSAIHKILTNASTEDLIFYGRVDMHVSTQVIPKCKLDLPNYEDLQNMDSESRMKIFLDILGIEEEFIHCIEGFPNSWHIFLIAMKYISTASIYLEWSLVYSLVLSKIMLTCVDQKVGRIRSWNDIIHGSDKCKVTSEFQMKDFDNVSEAIDKIDSNDCYNIFGKVLQYFELSTDMRNDWSLFNRNLVHSMSEFQSSLLHICVLNDLFEQPFEKCCIWECYNGTFIYNLFSLLKENGLDVIHNLLQQTPTIQNCFNSIIRLLKSQIKCLSINE